ncbi:MAG: hypothetical protein AAFR17_15645 [Pseudomonadota bacterium]
MRKTVLSLAIIGLVAACGQTRTDRAVSGAGIDAATGAAGSAVVGGDIAAGAIIGALGGAAVGAATDGRDIDLGTPIWRR